MAINLKQWIVVILCLSTLLFTPSLQAKSTGGLARAQASLEQAEGKFGTNSLKIVRYLNRLAKIYWKQGNKARAITLYKRALALQEKQLGYSHPDTLLTVRRLAFLTKRKNSTGTQQKIRGRLNAVTQKRKTAARKISQLQHKKRSLSQKSRRMSVKARTSLEKTKQLMHQKEILEQKRRAAFPKQSIMKHRHRKSRQQLYSLQRELHSQKGKQATRQRLVNSLNQKTRSANAALGRAQHQQRSHKAALRSNLSQISRQSRILSGGNSKVRSWQQQQARARRKLRGISPSLARIASQKRRLIAQIRKADKKNRPALTRKLASLRSSENRLRRSSTTLKRTISSLGRKIAQFKSSQSTARRRLAQLRRKTSGLKQKIGQDARKIRSAKATLQSVKKGLRSQTPLLKAAKRMTANTQKKLSTQHQKTRQVQKQYLRAKSNVQNINSRIKSADSEIRQSRANATKYQQQATQLRTKRQSLLRSEEKYKTTLRQSRRKENNLSASLRTVRKMLAPSKNIADITRDPAKPLTDSLEQLVRVYYGTDRNDLGEDKKTERYGVKRSKFSYGYSDVSIPPNHVPGALEGYSWLKFEFSPNPKKHVVLTKITRLNKDDFFERLTTKIDSTENRDAFIFVHGYYNSFKDAARRTAQMAFDMGFEGAPIFYSWPSQGSVTGYPVDSSNVEWGQGHLQDFIVDIIRKTKATRLHLIAHSMGTRALAKSLVNIRQLLTDEEQDVLKEIILAAPDIDASLFLESIAPKIQHENSRITVYTSKKDKALDMSKRYNGFARLGNLLELTKLPQGVDVIDASNVITSFVGHSYFGSNTSIISDMRAILVSSTPLDKRCYLKPTTTEIGKYWLFLLGKCQAE